MTISLSPFLFYIIAAIALLGQAFAVDSTFIKYPDENLVTLNILSAGSNGVGLVGGIGVGIFNPPAGAGIFVAGEVLSAMADLSTIAYIGWNYGLKEGIKTTGEWAITSGADKFVEKKLQQQLMVAEEKVMVKDVLKMLTKETSSLVAPSVLGAIIDLGSIVEEGYKGSVISVTPNP